MMFNRFFALLGVVVFTGCTLSPYGNYAATSPSSNQQMAYATVTQLVKLYPPAQTRFHLRQPTADAFGTRLVQELRVQGYAVHEDATTVDRGEIGVDLRYVVDRPLANALYRITLWIDSQSLSGAFTVATDGKLSPVGAWVYKES